MLHQCNGWDGIEKKAKHPLDEEERLLNASLYAEGRSNTGEDELEEEDELDDGVLGNYRSRHMCTCLMKSMLMRQKLTLLAVGKTAG